MDRQTTFADIEDASRRRATKREAFLGPRTRPCPGRSWSPRSSLSTIPASAAAGPSGSRGCCACTSCSCGSASPTRASRTRSTTRGRSQVHGRRVRARRPGPRRHHAAEVPPDDRGAELPPCPLPKRCQKSARGLARREKRGSRGQRSRNTIRTPKDIKPIRRTFTLNL